MYKSVSFIFLIMALFFLAPSTHASADDDAIAPILARLTPLFQPSGHPDDGTPQTIEAFNQKATFVLQALQSASGQVDEFLTFILPWRNQPQHQDIPFWEWFDILIQSFLQIIPEEPDANSVPNWNPYFTVIKNISTKAIAMQNNHPMSFDWWMLTLTMLHSTCLGDNPSIAQTLFWAEKFTRPNMHPTDATLIYNTVATFIMNTEQEENLLHSALNVALGQSENWETETIYTNLTRVLQSPSDHAHTNTSVEIGK